MKKINIHIYLALVLIGILSSCEDFDLEEPLANFTILKLVDVDEYEETSTFEVGENVYIQNNGTGEIFTIYTGDAGHDGLNTTYVDGEGVEKVNIGFELRHPREEVLFSYSYSTAGTYTIKVIAITSFGEGDEIVENATTKTITIVEP